MTPTGRDFNVSCNLTRKRSFVKGFNVTFSQPPPLMSNPKVWIAPRKSVNQKPYI